MRAVPASTSETLYKSCIFSIRGYRFFTFPVKFIAGCARFHFRNALQVLYLQRPRPSLFHISCQVHCWLCPLPLPKCFTSPVSSASAAIAFSPTSYRETKAESISSPPLFVKKPASSSQCNRSRRRVRRNRSDFHGGKSHFPGMKIVSLHFPVVPAGRG